MSDISFKVLTTTPSQGEAQLPPFLGRNHQHILRVQTEPRLPSPKKRRSEKRKPFFLFMMATAIIGLSISAMLGVYPTNPGGNSPVPTEVHKD